MRRWRLFLVLLSISWPMEAGLAQETAPDGGRVTTPRAEAIDPGRFSDDPADMAYGAFQRGYYLTALNLATPLAIAGSAPAQTLIAEIYSRGLGVRQDLATATEWYDKAAAQGDTEAQFQLAMILIDGGEEFGDHRRAGQLLERAAEAGHLMAQFNYAQWLIDDNQGTTGLARAVDYYDRAAQGGLADAQYAMAEVYRNGVAGRSRDLGIARTWLERAARQNHDTAQIDLGAFLIEGIGGERDLEAGFGWTMRAARAGNIAAQNRVALLYRSGIGVEPDSIAAAAWYMRARAAGLVDPLMEDHLAGLTDDQIGLAARQARVL
jgi:TPR repeat protein